MKYLMNYNWPGNIRELENIIERCVVITESDVIDADSLPQEILSYGKQTVSVSGTNVASGSSEPLLNSAIDDREKEVIIKSLRIMTATRQKLHWRLA